MMLMLGLNETIDHFAIVGNMHWYEHMPLRKDSNILKRALELDGKGRMRG